jgi:hypothetical protein
MDGFGLWFSKGTVPRSWWFWNRIRLLVSLPLPLFRYPRSEKDNLLLKAIF